MPAPALSPSWAGVHPDVWQADALAGAPARVLATGDALLDAQLPGGGWPLGALSEVLQPAGVHSEWRLLLPALARSGMRRRGAGGRAAAYPLARRWARKDWHPQRLLWVAAPAGAQRLWATEQALRCADVDAVLAWLVQVRPDQLRRLQMASAEFDKLLFVLRPERAQAESSPAALRLWAAARAAQRTWVMHWRCVPSSAVAHPWCQTLHLAARPPRGWHGCWLQANVAPMQRSEHALDRTAACV
jgi:protein ImuA